MLLQLINYHLQITRMALNRFVTLGIAAVWFVNGLFCKVLNFTPRHELIVKEILRLPSSRFFTVTIGILEVFMAIWILSGIKSRLNAITQIIVIGLMNILEYIMVPELLLWGRMNLIFAFMFMSLIAINEVNV